MNVKLSQQRFWAYLANRLKPDTHPVPPKIFVIMKSAFLMSKVNPGLSNSSARVNRLESNENMMGYSWNYPYKPFLMAVPKTSLTELSIHL